MLKLGDIMIIAGLALIPLFFSIAGALAWLRHGPGNGMDLAVAIFSGLIAETLGLVTAGILIKRNCK